MGLFISRWTGHGLLSVHGRRSAPNTETQKQRLNFKSCWAQPKVLLGLVPGPPIRFDDLACYYP